MEHYAVKLGKSHMALNLLRHHLRLFLYFLVQLYFFRAPQRHQLMSWSLRHNGRLQRRQVYCLFCDAIIF